VLRARFRVKLTGNSDFVLGDKLAHEKNLDYFFFFFKISVLVFLTRKPSRMKIHIIHPGMSYMNSSFKLDKRTFIIVAECLDNAFSHTV